MNHYLRPIVLSSFFLSIVALVFRPGDLSVTQVALSVAIIWVGITPALLYIRKPSQGSRRLPLMSLTGLFYALFFGFSGFLASSLRGTGSPKAISLDRTGIHFYEDASIEAVSVEAQILVLVGISLMFGAWAITCRALLNRCFVFRVPMRDYPLGLLISALLLALGAISYLIVPSISSIPSIGQFLQPAGYVAFSVFYLMHVNKKLPRLFTFVYFLFLFPIWIASIISTGLFTSIILICVLWAALRITIIGSVPVKFIISSIILFVFLYPQLNVVRDKMWGGNENKPRLEKVLDTVQVIPALALGSAEKLYSGDFHYKGLVRRISFILPFSHVVNLSPNIIPYWNGTTYQTLFISVVPRMLWKDKPEERWGNEFGMRYNIISESDGNMSVNIPWITELYVNFGGMGVILGMLLIGSFMGLLDHFFNSKNSRIIEKSIFAGLVLPLFYQESNFTLMTGGLIPQTFAMWIYFTVLMGFIVFFTERVRRSGVLD